jgi:nucleoid-associated protein YgaU
MKRVVTLFGLGLLLLWMFGCSGTGGLKKNVEEGQYYSEDEYAKLSNSQKEAYCEALAKELALVKQGSSERETELTTTQAEMEKLRSELTPLEDNLLKIESDIRTMERSLQELEALPKTWTIKPGECLWTIAGYKDVYSDPVKWPRIYRANLGTAIIDPDYIFPDTVLVIPRDWPHEHRVLADECLWSIAGYWEVYNSPWEWPKLYEANKDQIKDPDVIVPEQVLAIPRSN